MDIIVSKTIIVLGIIFTIGFFLIFFIERRKRKREPGISDLWKKYLSWVVIAPLILFTTYFGSPTFNIFVIVLIFLYLMEFFRLTKISEINVYKWEGRIFPVIILLTTLLKRKDLFYGMPMLVILVILCTPIFLRTTKRAVYQVSVTSLGVLYFGWMFGHLILIQREFGFGAIVFLCTLIAINDIMCYTTGKLFGKKKLVPKISPGKTLEGSLGGLISVILLSLLFQYALPQFSYWQCMIIGVIISICGQMGDLVISVIKRDMHVKDSGSLVPGHGGMLDRFDSLIFSIPIYYFILWATA
ncbi:phosphatidate cytidylyltransferase [candidate division WOR-3 bacterium]|nr:phosphatidate cytidylyltransferase [candidate division WOR-3 bacterium]